MSDITDKNFKPDASVEESQLRHSGDLGLEQPVKEFDNTSLEEAHNQGLIETPADPSPIEEAQPLSVPPEQGQDAAHNGRKWLVPVVGLGLAAASFLGYRAGAGGDDAEPKEREIPADTATNPSVSETPTTATPTTETPPEMGSGTIERVNSPVEMTANNPEGLIEAYDHNLNCMHNSPTIAEQEACALKLTAGRMEGMYDALVREINNVNQEKATNPDYNRDPVTEVVDHQMDDMVATIVINVDSGGFEESWALEFIRRQDNTEDPEAWELFSKTKVDQSYRIPR